MNAGDDLGPALRSWFERTSDAPPPDLHARVIQRVRGSRQRPAWLAAIRIGSVGRPGGAARAMSMVVLFGTVVAIALLGVIAVLAGGRQPAPRPSPALA